MGDMIEKMKMQLADIVVLPTLEERMSAAESLLQEFDGLGETCTLKRTELELI